MARVGRFGGRRRVNTANLTMLIASLLREQRQAEDRAAFDAWQNGGEFKGQKMTDDRILAYIKGRRDSMSTDDPLWDEWNNQLTQTKFTIGEQKVGLAFKQGKMGAGAVANWYKGQLKNIPKDSAFYRDVAGRAADWAKSAASAARGAGRARSYSAAQSRVERIKGQIAAHDAFVEALTEEARRRGIVSGNDDLTEADATRLQGMFDDGVVINGKRVTFEDWRQSSIGAYNAMGKAIPAYKALGWDTSGLRKDRRKFLNDYIAKLNIVDERAAYETAREAFEEDAAAAAGDPAAIRALQAGYQKTLQAIYDGAVGRTEGLTKEDADFLGGVANEIEIYTTGKAVGPTPYGDKDANDTAKQMSALVADADALESGDAYWGQESFGGPATVIYDPYRERDGDPALQRFVVRSNGKTRATYMRGQEVKTAVVKDPSGNVVSADTLTGDIAALVRQGWSVEATDQIAGYTFLDPDSKKRTYGVTQPDGSLRFTDKNPFASQVFGLGDSTVVIGAFDDGADVDPESGVPVGIRPFNVTPTDLLLTPTIGQMSQNEMRHALLKEVKAGEDPEVAKAQFDNWMRDKQPKPKPSPMMGTQRPPGHDGRGTPARGESAPSPASQYLDFALGSIGQSLAPLLNPGSLKLPAPTFGAPPRPSGHPTTRRVAPPTVAPATATPIAPPKPPPSPRPRRQASAPKPPPSLAPVTPYSQMPQSKLDKLATI